MTSPDLLVPTPHEVRSVASTWRPAVKIRCVASAGAPPVDELALRRVAGELGRFGAELDGDGRGELRLHRLDDATAARLGAEGYELEIGASGVDMAASTTVGCFRACTTLAQWLRLHRDSASGVGGLRVRDRPDFIERGLLLDISRNRVPTLDELEALVDLAAELKLNQLQLYTEHTFAYRGHEDVWRGWSPMTASETEHLATYAAARHVRLVPNQNSFGHMHRWLVHPAYRRLAEVPEGIEHPFSPHKEPFGLAPTTASLEFLRGLYEQLLPLTDAPLFNANLDETLDLGLGRSRGLCEKKGAERVYLDFVRRVHGLVAAHGKRMMMWGDIILKRPELIPELPEDVILLEWGYEAAHPFAEDCARFAAAGRELYVCPGTGSWSTFGGRTENTWANLTSAATHGKAHGATGFLLTDWGDHGHLQPSMVSWPALLAGASVAWNVASGASQDGFRWGDKLDAHVLRDPVGGAGAALLDLGRVQDLTGVRSLNGAPLFYGLMQAHVRPEQRRDVGSDPAALDRALEALDDVLGRWRAAPMARPDRRLLVREGEWVGRALGLGAEVLRARLDIGETRPLADLDVTVAGRLRRRLEELQEELGPIWRRRSRVGGLDASIARLGLIGDHLPR